MELDFRYYKTKGIYTLNGIRTIPLPRGSLELIQDYVGNILGLATKSIFDDAMSTTTYSFLTDLIKTKQLRLRGEEQSEDEIFEIFERMGFGHMGAVSKDIGSYSITVEKGFNSVLGLIKPLNYCFLTDGLLTAIYRIIIGKDIKVSELKCKTTGSSDIDWFEVNILDQTAEFNYISSPEYELGEQNFEKIDLEVSDYGILINSIPVEIVPVIFFPYLFGKLRKIIGMGVYGIQYGIGTTMSKLYLPYPLTNISTKYQSDGFEILSPLAGVGLVKQVKNDFGGIREIEVSDSFNVLHLSQESERRCFLLSGIFTGLSYGLVGTHLKIKEVSCSAMNNPTCTFSFE